MDAAIVAKDIRKALKEAFPGIKFSVRTRKYSMGQSIDVSWTDGPSGNQVNEITKKFECVHRDQFGDILSGGNMYVMTHREVSPELREWAKNFYYEIYTPDEREWERDRMINCIAAFDPDYTASPVDANRFFEDAIQPEKVKEEAIADEPVEFDPYGIGKAELKEVKPYFVEACYARLNKNSTIQGYVREVKNDDYDLELTEIKYEVRLNVKQWNDLLDGNLLTDYDWMDGKGGHNSHYIPARDVEHIWQMTEEELEEWRKHAYRANCILVTCGHRSIVVDPQGYKYARYVGINVYRTNVTKLSA